MKIKNKLNILLIGGIALSSASYADNLQLLFLQNIIQYIKKPEDLISFLQVNKRPVIITFYCGLTSYWVCRYEKSDS